MAEPQTSPLAALFNVQRCSTEDGPGIRTTAFFKGCPMTCPWCHNPEGMNRKPEVMWYGIDCVACCDCVQACPEAALFLDDGGMRIDRARCKACGTCAETCGPGAMELIGKMWAPAELIDEVMKDKTFYDTSGGGVTLSGGEPLMYVDFLAHFLAAAKKKGLHVALDTCGSVPSKKLAGLLDNIDLVLFDIKLLDEARHKEYTGVDLRRVLENAAAVSSRKVPLWIRTPVIPGYTDGDDNVRGIAAHIKKSLASAQRFDLLAFSNLCTSKYERLGRTFAVGDGKLLTASRMEELAGIARDALPVEIEVTWSGPTRV
ncbi:MAG: glycyl-radical enzyme activating protein [Pseudomonadota bacterium]